MLYDPFTLEKLREWRAWDPAVQSTYAPFGRRVKFTDVSIREAVWLLRPEFPSHHRVFENLRGRVQSFFPSPCFFRLSTRSPKDAWRSLDADLGIDPEQDDASERDRKYEQQMRLLRVKSFEDVLRLLRSSERCTDDLQMFVEKEMKEKKGGTCARMKLVFIEWNEDMATRAVRSELRCFVRRRKLIAKCPCMISLFTVPNEFIPEINVDLHVIEAYMESLAILTEFDDFVADVFVRSPTCFDLVEMNEFDEFTDPVAFDWNDLMST
jgi:hypothetical protein